MNNQINNFIKAIEQFADRHGMSDTGVSTFLTKSPGYLGRLRKGQDTGTRKQETIRQKMKSHDMKMGVK